MKKIRISAMAIILMIAMILFPLNAFAGSAKLQLSANKTNIDLGDIVVITVRFDAPEALDFVGASITYDSNRLAFIEGGGMGTELSNGTGAINGFGNSGADSFEYTFTFKAISEGTAYFRLRNCEALSYYSGKNILSSETDRIVITIGKSSGEPDEQDPEFTPPKEDLNPPGSENINDNNKIQINDISYNIISDESLSDILAISSFNFNGIDFTSYIADAEYLLLEENSKKYLYDISSQKIKPIIIISNSNALIPTDPPVENYTTITIDSHEVKAIPTSDSSFYIVYCKNAHNQIAAYYYDSLENTFQKAADYTTDTNNNVTEDVTDDHVKNIVIEKDSDFSPVLMIAAGAAVVLLIILIIAVSSKRR